MSGIEIILLTAAAFCTSALTAVVGAGGGTALIALMLQVIPPAAAIPVHGIVQLASNMTRVCLLWHHMSWPMILRFSALMPLGVALGLMLFQGLPQGVVEILIGIFVLLSLGARQIGRWRESELPLWAFYPIGLITGMLNMIVGVIAPILGVLIIRKDLTKESMVGTLGFFGFIGNLLKIAGFTLIGFSFVDFGPLILCMLPAAIIGTKLGRILLSRLDQKLFLFMFHMVLIALALKLIVIDGLGWFVFP